MSLIMMFLLLVIFLILILLSFIFKKKILYVVLCLMVIVVVSYILKNTVFYYDADSISVIKNDYESFDIKVKNHQIRYAGSYVEFSCKYSKQRLFEELLKQYKNTFFDEKFNQIVVVSDNQIYTISDCGSSAFLGTKKHKYIIKRKCFKRYE